MARKESTERAVSAWDPFEELSLFRELGFPSRLSRMLREGLPRGERWEHYAIEINLRKGGTTHTLGILQFLTEGAYDTRSGLFMIPSGEPRFYQASDNLKNPDYQRLTPDDLIDIAVERGLHYKETTQKGVFFHLIGALSGHGKLGLVCVAGSPEEADSLYRETVETLDREAARS